jgi:ABC-2 type transport system ATP-binding protein
MSQIGQVDVENVWKTFRIFQNRNTTLKQALTRRGGEQFRDFWALQDVSFNIPSGSTFGLVGANGAGKSTMLKLLTRIMVPDRGRVATHGRVSALLELGAGFHPELSGRENIFLNGSILGMSAASLRARLDEIVDFSGLEEFIDQPVKTYSSGMYARLGFSVAVAVEPDILLIDEVLAVGDEQFQRRCTEKMAEMRSGGRTVILVSHSLATVQQICDQAVWLDHGRVRATGNTEDVVNDYLASVTTTFRLDERGRQRTGTGEVSLEGELVLPRGKSSPATGDPVIVRLVWSTDRVLDDVDFGFMIRTTDGYAVAGAGHSIDNATHTIGPGAGVVEYVIPKLALMPGAYHLAAIVLDRKTRHVYDHSPHMLEFDVTPNKDFSEDAGAVSLGGAWREKAL